MPREIIMDVLCFISRKELNNYLVINHKLNEIIESAGTKLPQLQEVKMETEDQLHEPFWAELSNGDTKIMLVEGQDNPKNVLKHCIVTIASCELGFGAFEDRFRKILKLTGAQKVPLKHFKYDFVDSTSDSVQDFTFFRTHFSSMCHHLQIYTND